jgi:hypothetical protein
LAWLDETVPGRRLDVFVVLRMAARSTSCWPRPATAAGDGQARHLVAHGDSAALPLRERMTQLTGAAGAA